MTLPENFTPVQHFKSVAIKSYNRFVKKAFKDIDHIGDDISLPRTSLREACLIDEQDSSILINNRMMLFYFTLRQAAELQAPLFGIPVGHFEEGRRYRPQVFLYFREDSEDVEEDYRPLEAQLTFRLMNETETTISKLELTNIARSIKTEFGTGDGYRWQKGKTLCTYYDGEKGYALHIYAYSVTEGKEVIGKILDIQNHAPDWSKLTINERDDPMGAFPTIPPSKVILGESQRMPRRRPVGYVRFLRATCSVWGLNKPVALYDKTGYHLDALVDDSD